MTILQDKIFEELNKYDHYGKNDKDYLNKITTIISLMIHTNRWVSNDAELISIIVHTIFKILINYEKNIKHFYKKYQTE